MDDVQFNEPEIARPVSAAAPTESAMTRLFIKFGIAKDQKSAQRAGLVVAIIAIALTLFIIIPDRGPEPVDNTMLTPGMEPMVP